MATPLLTAFENGLSENTPGLRLGVQAQSLAQVAHGDVNLPIFRFDGC
jgi:hypothetical protein